MSIAFGLIACTSQPGVSLVGQPSPTASTLATGRRRLTVNVEIESLIAASDARILVGGHVDGPPYGPGLHWVDLADGTVRRAFPPGGSSAIGSVFSKRAHARGHDLVVDAYPQGDPERPTLRHVLAVDPSRGSITPVVDVGPWSATTSRGDERFIASLDRVFRVSDHAAPGAPTLGGSWVLNETHWMDWMGPVLVSVTTPGDRVSTWREGTGLRFPDLTLHHPARWRDEIVGSANYQLVAWAPDASPRGRYRVLVKAFDREYGALEAPAVTSEDRLFLLTSGWVVSVDPVSGTVRGRVWVARGELGSGDPWLVPTMVGDGRGVWVAYQVTRCSNRGGLAGRGEVHQAPDRCLPKSELEYLSLEAFDERGAARTDAAPTR